METPGGTGAFALTAYMPSNGIPSRGEHSRDLWWSVLNRGDR